MGRRATVIISFTASMKTFTGVRSDWFLKIFGHALGSVEDCYIAGVDPYFAETTMLGLSIPTVCLPEANSGGEVDEEQQSAAHFHLR